MEFGATQNSLDDPSNACRSFGSNYQPSSQSRKISIGIMVDSLDKWRTKTTNENEAAVPNTGKTFRKLTSVGDISGREQAKADQEHNTSPWVTTKSTQPRNLTSEAVPLEKPPILDSQTGGSEFQRSNVENPGNRKLGFQSNIDNLKKFNRVYSRREVEEEGEREWAKELDSATAHEVFEPEREVVQGKAIQPEDRRQVLRMKLWEILGTNSTQNKQASQAPEMDGNNLNSELNNNRKCEAAVNPKQNSDTIESDSQSPNGTMKRAVTRSLTRKKAVSRTPTTKTRNMRKSTSIKKSLEKHVFSFNEGQFGKLHDAVNGVSPKSNAKGSRRKGSKVESRKINSCEDPNPGDVKINFCEDPNAGDVQKRADKSKTTKGPEKTSSIGNSMRSNQKSPPKNRSLSGPEKGNKEDGFSLLSAKSKGERGSKGEAARFSFPEKLISDEHQPAIDISKTISGANKTSSIGSIIRSYQNLPAQSSSRLVDTKNGNQENSTSHSSAMKKGRKGSKAEGGSISFPEKDIVEESRPAVDMGETTKDVKSTSSIGKRTRIYGTSLHENNSKFVDVQNGDRVKGSSLSPAKKKPTYMSFLGIPHRWVQHEDFGTSPFKSATDSHVDLQSPTFDARTPAESFSIGSPPKANHGKLDDQSPENYSFNTPAASKPDDYYTPGTEKSNDTERAEDQDAEYAGYKSSPEKMDSESCKEGWAYPYTGTEVEPDFVLYPNKRLRFSPILTSLKDLEESDESQGPPEENGENGLANAISLLASALQRVKSKIKKATSKKSTEVLMSVAEEVHLQLQNAESQFERDVGKLTSVSKSKRKHLETEIEGQQEQLKVIYQKFKEDVSQYIQDHRSKVEGLEGEEKELQLFMEKRKASQKEVLKQMEESIQALLTDAETKIAAVHKMGRDKMLQLKQVLGSCLKEGMLG